MSEAYEVRDSLVPSTPRSGDPFHLAAPNAPYADRSLASTPADSSPFLAGAAKENYSSDDAPYGSRRPLYKRPAFWLASAAAVAVVVLAVILPVYFVVIKPDNDHSGTTSGSSSSTSPNNSGSSGNSNTTSPSGTTQTLTIGTDGSTVTTDDGSTFTYKNSFGGYWVSNTENPYDNSARPNSWTPPLNQTWQWGVDRIWGVNLGGLFVPEPFIVPALFEANVGAVDEWTLSTLLSAKGSGTLQQTMEDHYNTFITEEDIAQIAGAGLNWIRLPIPFWAIETWSNVGDDPTTGQPVGEPFLARVCWQYILRVLGWARKYGLRVNLDLHTVPGSQNGYNHSGRFGSINWMKTIMGLANAERSLDYIRDFAEFISQPEWRDVVPMFGIVNEPYLHMIGQDQVQAFYLKAYEMIRDITGTGEGNGPIIAIHDGFAGVGSWAGFLAGADRLALDTHPYFAFDGQSNREPTNVTADGNSNLLGGQWPLQACNSWGASLNGSRSAFGLTLAGEFSNAINDCGRFVRGITSAGQPGQATYGDDCGYWEDASQWSDETKQGLKTFALASMDALGDYFFWTWKIGNSSVTNNVAAPLWSYQLGLQQGWMPTDPRAAAGVCDSLGGNEADFAGFAPWMTGGAGAGTITAATASITWPPTSLTDVAAASMTAIPQYTSTASPVTLPPLSLAASETASVTASAGSGWFDAKDTAAAVTPIGGCAYPFAWDVESATIPASGCTPAAAATAR